MTATGITLELQEAHIRMPKFSYRSRKDGSLVCVGQVTVEAPVPFLDQGRYGALLDVIKTLVAMANAGQLATVKFEFSDAFLVSLPIRASTESGYGP